MDGDRIQDPFRFKYEQLIPDECRLRTYRQHMEEMFGCMYLVEKTKDGGEREPCTSRHCPFHIEWSEREEEKFMETQRNHETKQSEAGC